MSNRVSKGVRFDPDMLGLAHELAKKIHGSESKIGYILDEGIQLVHAKHTQPTEAQSYLSNIERSVIRTLEQRIESVGRRATETIQQEIDRFNKETRRNGNLLTRAMRESIYTSLVLEEIGVGLNPQFKSEVVPELKKELATRVKRKQQYEGDQEAATYTEENSALQEKNEQMAAEMARLKEENNKLRRYAKQLKDEVGQIKQSQSSRWAEVEGKNEEIRKQKKDIESLQAWTRGLMTYLKNHYSRIKSNDTLIDEYIQTNHKPEGL
ncbi:hypothetical protein [Salinithrix halophila]|uniref:Mobilization protein n=1 Tax=Salinithrix halophila TaxID=1485204 RepID=A0ABV8JBQ7_9BACL